MTELVLPELSYKPRISPRLERGATLWRSVGFNSPGKPGLVAGRTSVSPAFKIIGILFKIHRELGPTLLERYYCRAIEQELQRNNIAFTKEVEVELGYQGIPIGKYRLDFLIDSKLILEVKAEKSYHPKFFKQVLSYLRQTKLPLAIIANFRRQSLEYKRIINPDLKNSNKFDNNSN